MSRFILISFIIILSAQELWAGRGSKNSLHTIPVPLKGKIINFSEGTGAYEYDSKVINYQSEDGAQIEATIVTPLTARPRPGIIYVHMWARDRHTFWGLPEFLASYGFPGIYMDLRGHGNSKMPGSNKKVTIKDKRKRYANLYKDIVPAINILNQSPNVKSNNLILIAASLGCPLSVIAIEPYQDKFLGMIHLSPSVNYFDVFCKPKLKKIKTLPTMVIAEATDKSFRGAKEFFSVCQGYKTWLQLDGIGHGTDILYFDIGVPTIILNWVRLLSKAGSNIHDLHKKAYSHPNT